MIIIKGIDYDITAKVFKAFCDSNRLLILEVLQTGEKCACVLQERLNMPQSTLSHHMKVLCESGIVVRRKDGKWSHYSISESKSRYAIELIEVFTKVDMSDVYKCCQK